MIPQWRGSGSFFWNVNQFELKFWAWVPPMLLYNGKGKSNIQRWGEGYRASCITSHEWGLCCHPCPVLAFFFGGIRRGLGGGRAPVVSACCVGAGGGGIGFGGGCLVNFAFAVVGGHLCCFLTAFRTGSGGVYIMVWSRFLLAGT